MLLRIIITDFFLESRSVILQNTLKMLKFKEFTNYAFNNDSFMQWRI